MKLRLFPSAIILAASTVVVAATAADIVWLRPASTPGISLGADPAKVDYITYRDDHSALVVGMKSGASQAVDLGSGIEMQPGVSDGTVNIALNGSTATVENPLAFEGVTVEVSGAHVSVVAASGAPVAIKVSGSSTDGQVKVYGTDAVTLELDGASITNPTGSAVNFQSEADATLILSGNSTLLDGASYSTPSGESEKGTIYAGGNLTIAGSGAVTLAGQKKHAIVAEGSVTLASGSVTVTSAASDGIHSEGVAINGGSYTSAATVGDAIDAGTLDLSVSGGSVNCTVPTDDTKGLKADGNITISGGTITITLTGDQVKGIKSKGDIAITGGSINANASGNAVVVDGDPSYCTVVKADGNFTLSGDASLYFRTTGMGGKGISVDLNATFTGGTVDIACSGNGNTYTTATSTTDAYSSTCITVDGDLYLQGGTFTLANSGSAGKCIKSDGQLFIGAEGTDGPTITAGTTGSRITVSSSGSSGGWPGPGGPGGGMDSGDYSNPKVVKAVGNLTVNSGTLTLSSTQDGGEGLESKATLTINGGTLDISTYDDCINAASHLQINGGTTRCIASGNDGIDSNGTLTITGGTTIACGTRSPEEGFDCDNNRFTITGGVIVGIGGATSSPTASACTQHYGSFSASVSTGTLVTVCDPSGNQVLSIVVPVSIGTARFLVSAPAMTTGSHKVYKAGTVTGGTTVFGLTTGATYTAGTQPTTFTAS